MRETEALRGNEIGSEKEPPCLRLGSESVNEKGSGRGEEAMEEAQEEEMLEEEQVERVEERMSGVFRCST